MVGDHAAMSEIKCLMAMAVGKVECSTRSLDALKPGEIRVQHEVSMVSPGTELHHILATHTKQSIFPRSTGYISVGRIVGLGDGVKDRALGQRVLIHVGHMSFSNSDAARSKVVPEGVDPVDAAATVLLAISLRGIRGGQVRFGDSVAVFGAGMIGAFAVHLAKLNGAFPVIAIDPVPKRREVARELGADLVLDPIKCDVKKEVFEATGGEGARVAIDATGTPKVISTLPNVTAEFGRVVVLGGVHGAVEMDLYTRFQKSNLTMVGCGSPYPSDYPFSEERNELTLLNMIKAGMVRPRPAVTHFVPWRRGPEMYKMLIERKDEVIGVAFDWREQ